jgi:hypothetical protein
MLTHVETYGQYLSYSRATNHTQIAGRMADDVCNISVSDIDAFGSSCGTFMAS